MRISDWSSDVCSSDRIELVEDAMLLFLGYSCAIVGDFHTVFSVTDIGPDRDCWIRGVIVLDRIGDQVDQHLAEPVGVGGHDRLGNRSEEHTSELQSLMRISYAVLCLKKKKQKT